MKGRSNAALFVSAGKRPARKMTRRVVRTSGSRTVRDGHSGGSPDRPRRLPGSRASPRFSMIPPSQLSAASWMGQAFVENHGAARPDHFARRPANAQPPSLAGLQNRVRRAVTMADGKRVTRRRSRRHGKAWSGKWCGTPCGGGGVGHQPADAVWTVGEVGDCEGGVMRRFEAARISVTTPHCLRTKLRSAWQWAALGWTPMLPYLSDRFTSAEQLGSYD
jgi:hypothetical protein